jgi:hypothetical protein
MPGPSAFNRRFNSMAGKQAAVGLGKKKARKPVAKRRPAPAPPFPAAGRPNPFASKRGRT